MKNLRLAIACSGICLGKGGSERTAVNMAVEMSKRGHYALLLGWEGPGRSITPAYRIPADIPFIAVNPDGKHDYIDYLRNYLVAQKIDVFLSLQCNSAHLLWQQACLGSGIPFICSERVDPIYGIEKIYWNRPGRLAALAGADCIHELLPGYADSVPDHLRQKVVVIPNGAPYNPLVHSMNHSSRKSVLYLARLCEQKRPYLLVEAFCGLMDKYPEWDLEIWGHGLLEKILREQIIKAGSGNRIRFHGQCDNPAQAYAASDIYCLPSSHEGFPNTVLEAMSAGLPTVGFKSCAALADIVEDNKTGLLAPENNAASLALTLERLMSDCEMRAKFGLAAKEAAATYAPATVYDQWEQLFQTLSKSRDNTIMDKLAAAEFACRADLSTSARQEWVFRNYGESMPWSFAWLKERAGNLVRNLYAEKFSKGAA